MNQKDCTGALSADLKKCHARTFTSNELQSIERNLSIAYYFGYMQGRIDSTNHKPVLQIDKYGKAERLFFDSKTASKATGANEKSIRMTCNGQRHTAGGLKFIWQSDYEKLKNIHKDNSN